MAALHFCRVPGEPPVLIAHRGCSASAPENSLASIRRALEHGIPWVEVDVHLSADDEVVVIHDRTLRRTTSGRGPVRAHSYDALRTLDAGSWFDPSFAGERIPRLSDVLQLIGETARLNIEVKTFLVGRGSRRHLAEHVLSVIERSRAAQRVLITSFDHRLLRTIRDLDPIIPLGVLFSWPRDVLQTPTRLAGAAGAKVFVCDKRRLDATMLTDAHANDIAVFVYTVNDPVTAGRFASMGVDGLISDCPDVLVNERLTERI